MAYPAAHGGKVCGAVGVARPFHSPSELRCRRPSLYQRYHRNYCHRRGWIVARPRLAMTSPGRLAFCRGRYACYSPNSRVQVLRTCSMRRQRMSCPEPSRQLAAILQPPCTSYRDKKTKDNGAAVAFVRQRGIAKPASTDEFVVWMGDPRVRESTHMNLATLEVEHDDGRGKASFALARVAKAARGHQRSAR